MNIRVLYSLRSYLRTTINFSIFTKLRLYHRISNLAGERGVYMKTFKPACTLNAAI